MMVTPRIPPIPNATPATRLFLHAVGGALACAGQGVVVKLTLPPRQPSPLAQKQAVAEHLAAVMTDVEKFLRAQRAPVTRMPQATTGRILVQRDEVYDAVAKTYTPGWGFVTLINAITVDAMAEMERNS
ncbi:hypothetical protein C5U48_02580 [Mycolicibacter virginiensis]|uniref:Uncharacterized protein n=1 Tax=Mycolicibacter virginiensis TaxID=1795032 RepID=A0A9X7IQT7_9MYCO|nr:hypothetical protein [Mycolicibacter virginiensis]PQM53715.1 hypothetical protein C5U48_02580 [Mycolicibacter virginiensis]